MRDGADKRERRLAARGPAPAEAWAAIEIQQRRAATDWAEANRYIAEQTAALDARAAELDARANAAADQLAAAEAEAAGLREEAAALEQRIQNARAALTELELRRDRARAELLHVKLPFELGDNPHADDLAQRELLLTREKGAVAALRSSLELESADLDDRRRLVVEQLTQLADARTEWQRTERQTVAEMEHLGRSLALREQALDAREVRLIRADARRREDAHDLWRLRLRLEAWQSRLVAFEVRWHTEREELEANLRERVTAVARREAAAAATFARWEQARLTDHSRLRAEVERWTAERAALAKLAEKFDRQHAEFVAETAAHAARALAAEELVVAAVQDSGSTFASRRLVVLRKRWERFFAREANALSARRAEAAAERETLERRIHELRRLLTEAAVPEREPAEAPPAQPLLARLEVASAANEELTVLRAEIERLAASVIAIEFPGLPELAELEASESAEASEMSEREPVLFGDSRAA